MLEYGFYNSIDGDRRYNATQMSEIFEGLITDGIYPSVGDKFTTTPGEGLQIIVGTGRAWFNGTWSRNKSKQPITLSIPDPVFARIDTVCLKIDKSDAVRANSITVVKGTVATTPKPPNLPVAKDVFYHPLANIRVRAAASAITAADIEILVGKSSCPFTTSILQQTNIDSLFAQWDKQFHDWWDSLKLVLEGDVAANLIGAIDQINTKINTINTNITNLSSNKVNKADKATFQNVTVSGNDNFWVSASVLRSLYNGLPKLGLDTSGILLITQNFTFTAPATGRGYAILVGGGGAGATGACDDNVMSFGGGGGSGEIKGVSIEFTKNSTYSITIGKGGTSVIAQSYPSSFGSNGPDGKSTSIGSVSVSGGKGGVSPNIASSTSLSRYPIGGDGFNGGGGGGTLYSVRTGSTSYRRLISSSGGKSIYTANIFGISVPGSNGKASKSSNLAYESVHIIIPDFCGDGGSSIFGSGGTSFGNGRNGEYTFFPDQDYQDIFAGGGGGFLGKGTRVVNIFDRNHFHLTNYQGYNDLDYQPVVIPSTGFGYGGAGAKYAQRIWPDMTSPSFSFIRPMYSEAGGDGCVILFFPTE